MAEPKWTPAPWWFEYHKPGTDTDDGAYLCHEGGSIFEGCFVLESDAENAANAGLIAAAPELYMTLSALVYQVERSGAVDDHGHKLINLKALHDSRAVLAKARGEAP